MLLTILLKRPYMRIIHYVHNGPPTECHMYLCMYAVMHECMCPLECPMK